MIFRRKWGSLAELQKRWKVRINIYIEGILYVRQAASRKAGGQGIRYVCEVEGSIAVLFRPSSFNADFINTETLKEGS